MRKTALLWKKSEHHPLREMVWNGSFYPVNFSRFHTCQVVLLDFWSINRSTQLNRSGANKKSKRFETGILIMTFSQQLQLWQFMGPGFYLTARWFKVPFSSPSWRSLNPLKGSLNHPKKVTLNHQVFLICQNRGSTFQAHWAEGYNS